MRLNIQKINKKLDLFYLGGLRAVKKNIANPESKKSGSVLIIVLWVIGLLSMFVAAFAFDMHIEARIVSAWRKKLKAEYLSRAGIELARMALLETADPEVTNPEISGYISEGVDSDRRAATVSLAHGGGAELSRRLGEGAVTVRIRPENARINLNSIVNANNRDETFVLWEPIFETAGVPFEERDALIDCLMDWVDADELTHLNGAESEYYETLTPPYKSKNAPIDTVDELALVKGFNDKPIAQTTQTVYAAVARFLTTYAEDRTININAVDHDTLMAYLGVDSPMAEEIIFQRSGLDGEYGTEDDTPFKDLGDLLARVPGLDQSIAPYVSFTSRGRFYIQSSGKVGDVERVCACVVLLAENNLTILSWIEGDSASADLITR
ncbi:MAG: type II secretion system protein GspK [Kiritimatiellae bacterium]|nr:type II secretion system protein GspK [Kiritimatiellia bacterium]